MDGDPFIQTKEPSGKTFSLPTGQTTRARNKAKLYHHVREPARTIDMVPDLKHNSLLSLPKFADANYVTVLTPTEILIYDGSDIHLAVDRVAVL